MKKHNFKEALDIFKGMFEGWVAVTNVGKKHAIDGFDYDPDQQVIYFKNGAYMEFDISHLEQTKPINGDEVWAWDGDENQKRKGIYVGKITNGMHIIEAGKFAWRFETVELISPTRKITIQEATEMLRGIVTEPFEITKE